MALRRKRRKFWLTKQSKLEVLHKGLCLTCGSLLVFDDWKKFSVSGQTIFGFKWLLIPKIQRTMNSLSNINSTCPWVYENCAISLELRNYGNLVLEAKNGQLLCWFLGLVCTRKGGFTVVEKFKDWKIKCGLLVCDRSGIHIYSIGNARFPWQNLSYFFKAHLIIQLQTLIVWRTFFQNLV